MPLLYYKDPADGQFKPYIPAGQDANAIMSEHEAAVDPHTQYVNKSGDTMTGNLDANGMAVGKVWTGGHYGIQPAPIAGDSKAAILLDNTSGTGDLYVIGGANKVVRIRPRANVTGAEDYWFTTTGLTIPFAPTAVNHAVRKDYVDGSDAALTYTSPWKARASHRAAFRKRGAMVFCQMSLDVTANVGSTGSTVAVGTIPVGYRPTEYVGMPATWVNSSGAPGSGLLVAYPDGQFRFLFASGQTLTPGTHVATSGSWPAA